MNETLSQFLITLPVALACGVAIYFFLNWAEKKWPDPTHPAPGTKTEVQKQSKPAEREELEPASSEPPAKIEDEPNAVETAPEVEKESPKPAVRSTYNPRPPKKSKSQRKKKKS